MIATQIDAVTVFRQGASIQRLATVEGPGTRVLKGFPLCMDDDIRVEASDGLRCVDARVEFHTPEAEDVEAFDEELSAAHAAVARATSAVDLLNAELERLRGLGFNDAESKDPLAAAEARSRLLDFRRAEVLRIIQERAATNQRLREASEALATLKARAERSHSRAKVRANQLQKVVRVRLEGEGSATLKVTYGVPGAGWASTLQVRFNAQLDQAELRRGVLVRHRTGEDWSDVRLRVTTAEPSRWTELETLHPLRIGRAQPELASTWRPPPTGTEGLFADYDRAFGRARRWSPTPPPPPAPLQDRAEEVLTLHMDSGVGRPEGAGTLPPGMPPPAPSMSLPPKAPPRVRAKRAMVGAETWMAAEATDAGVGGKLRDRAPRSLVEADAYRRYAQLRMRGPEEGQRGTLQLSTAALPRRLGAALSLAMKVHDFPDSRSPATGVEGFDFAWTVPHRVTVPGDGAVHAFALERAQTDATLNLVVVPRQASDVFRRVELHNRLPQPLLPGPAEIYVDGRYLLTTRIKALATDESVVLSLGVEQGVEVVRNASFQESSEGLLVAHLELRHSVEVTLRSHLDRAVSVDVRERLPQPAEGADDVKVVDKGDWEDWPEEHGGLDGGRRWRVQLAPRSEKTLSAEYRIELPGKHELVGGNRREP